MLINYETHVSRYMCGGRGMKRFVGGSLSVVATKKGGNTRIFCGKCMESCRVEDGREIPWVIGRDLTNFYLDRVGGDSSRDHPRTSSSLTLDHIPILLVVVGWKRLKTFSDLKRSGRGTQLRK